MTVLEYERRFQDLSMFASVYLPTKQHRIERLRDGLRQELRMGLAALQFPTVRDFIVAAQSLEAVAAAGRREGDGHGIMGAEKRKEHASFTGRPPFPKKGKGGHFGQFRKKGGNFGSGGTSSRFVQSSHGGRSHPQTSLPGGVAKGSRMTTYPLCVRCEHRHPGDCSATSGRCYICRQKHRCRDCPYLNDVCYHCGEPGHRKRECPQRTMGQAQRQGFSVQSQQQSATVDRPGRPAQSGTSAVRGRPRVQGGGVQGRVFRMTQEDMRAATDVVSGTLLLESQLVYTLIDPGATHSFVARKCEDKLKVQPMRVGKGVVIGTPLGETVLIEYVYKGCRVRIGDVEMMVDLLPLDLYDFEMILGMDWLVTYRAQIDCFTKTVTLQDEGGRRVEFRGERNIIPNSIISVVTARKLLRNGCTTYLAYVVDLEKKEIELDKIPVVREFPDVFPKELPGLPHEREVEVVIETLPGTTPVAQAPYRMVPAELVELKIQLQELLDKGFIRPSVSP